MIVLERLRRRDPSDPHEEPLLSLRVPATAAGALVVLAFARPVEVRWYAAGLALALAGETLRLWAACHLRKDKELVEVGPYAMLRHPLYLGSGLVAAGVALASVDPARPGASAALALALGAAYMCVYGPAMLLEERRLRRLFGERFDAYASRVPRLLPEPSGFAAAVRTHAPSPERLSRNGELKTFGWLVAALALLPFLGRLP